MPSGKQYEMLFKLNAQANSGFKGAFSQAQAEFAKLGSQIQSLNRAQGDISAYQKQQAAIDRTQARLENLTKQHALLGQQIQNTTGDTSALEREQLKLEQRMAGAQSTLENQQGRLSATTQRLEEAGVSMDDLSGESARLADEIQELSQQQEAAARSAEEYRESAVSAFDAAASALAAAGIVGGIKQIGEAYIGTVQAAGEFGAAMSNAEALSGATSQQMALLTAQAKELGATTKFTANESGEAMGYMGMAGWNAQQMLAGMPGVLDLAAASGEDLAGVADIVTDSLTGFKLTAADTGEFVDVLAAASSKSNTNVSMLGESFKYVAPLAGTLGYSAQDTAVALGLMANSGIKAGQAGTTLRTALTNLVSPTEAQAAEMERLGLSLTDSNGQMLPMLDMVGNLRGAFSGMSEAQQSAAASTIFGKEAMSGMLAIINASEADYQSLTQSIYNSAGAAQRMAEIKLDNLAGDLTLMQSAADGLGLTIGEVFMPQIRGLVQAGTGVLTWVNKMIEAHPVMAKAILGAAGAVGVLTTGIVAYNAAKKVMAAVDLAALFTGPVGPILAVGAAVGAVTAGVMGLIEAANEGVPQVDELTQAAQESAQAMEQVSTDFDASRVNILATADVAGTYIARLDELGAKTSLTKAESQEYHNILQLLCDTVPDLAASIDLETDSIEGGTEALRAQTEAWKKNAEEQARQQAYQNLMSEYNDVLVEQAENSLRLTEAQMKLGAQEKRREEIMARQHVLAEEAGFDANKLSEEYYNLDHELALLNEDIRTGEKTVSAYQEALNQSTDAAEEAKAAAEGYADAMGALTGQAAEAANASEDVAASVLAMTDSLRRDAASGIVEAGAVLASGLGTVSAAYSEAYTTAYDSISGQMGLFEAMSVEVETSVGGMIASLQSQVAYMASYSENLRAAAQMGLSDGLIAQLSDGSAESAAYLQEIVSNGEGKIQELNDAFAQVEEGKEEFSSTVAEMQTDLHNTMQQAVQTTQSAVRQMDMYAQAAMSARSTMQGFIDGANGMAGAVQAAYRNVAYGAMAAIQGAMAGGLSVTRGYASGTTDAAPGFAMVGENGPELVFFQGGEQVLNARDTAALQARPSLSALPASTGGGEPVVVQIYFQIEGNATPDTVQQLRQYGDEFAANVIRVYEDHFRDVERRSY
ncbi:MAG: phage tail tape measure protein [Acutalibacter sp.]|nr:phage tail tape measure protein [Acutalibacter sp.]